jgi:polysaccharide biosynthesis transport protein
MQPERSTTPPNTSAVRAVRHHLAPVIFCVLLGAVAGWLYAGTSTASYTSVTKVLVNPSVGNPYAPTPSSVRQDELTSLETEAQVARSAEVLSAVSKETALTMHTLERGVTVAVPPNTQVLEISYTAADPTVARQVADAVAAAYLDNRRQRFDDVTAARIDRVDQRTSAVVAELRTAAAAAAAGTAADRSFQTELATALRSELVSLRAQRTALENSESPPGAVISPASEPGSGHRLLGLAVPIGGALAGLALGCFAAVLLERSRGVVRSAAEVDDAALPVVAAVPRPRRRIRPSFKRRPNEDFDATIRRLRGTILDLEPRPDVITVAPAGAGPSDPDVSEAVAESFARAGHRVVLVQAEGRRSREGLGVDRGLADALLHERLNPLDLLQPSVEPLLCLLPAGEENDQSRELFVANRLRGLLRPLIEAGNLVVVQSPGVDTAEGEALVGASDVGLVVVTLGVTRPREVQQIRTHAHTGASVVGALVVGERDAERRTRRTEEGVRPRTGRTESDAVPASNHAHR